MHDELSDQVELAPDIEWLLLSDQAKADDLLVYLVDKYGAGLSFLMQTFFTDSSSAEDALVESLVQIVLQSSRYRSGKPVEVWLYALVMDSAWRVRRKWTRTQVKPEVMRKDTSISQVNLPGWLEYLPEQSRLAIVLQHHLGLKQEEIAQVLGVPAFSIATDLAIADKAFPTSNAENKVALDLDKRQRLIQLTHRRLAMRQPRGRLRRTLLEMSWAVGALLLVVLLTRVYDLRNPDPARQVVEIPFLTPLPTSTRGPLPTATLAPILNDQSTSDDIAVLYWQRSLNVDSFWEDALVLLGGAQGGPIGHTVKRVEFGWDVKSRKMMILVGPPDGPPENGLFADDSDSYELTIRNGILAGVSALDLTQPKAWYYLTTLPFNLQINNFERATYMGLGSAKAAGRDALLVEVYNSEGITEVFTWLDKATAIPLRQQRSGEQGVRELGLSTSLVLDVIVNQLALDEPFPRDYFNIVPSRSIEFRADLGKWWTDPQVESSLRRMEQNSTARETNNPQSSTQPLLYYQVMEISNQEGMKYSTSVFAGREFSGEYPMGNPWSVQCERSPDGNRVAFIEDRRFEFGQTAPSQVLHWFSLDDPGVLHTPLPGVDATRFTFSPDSHILAVHASNEVSLIDLASGKVDFLLVLPAVDQLAFSDDGKYLGVLRNLPLTGGAANIWIIDVQAKKVVESLQFGSDQDWVSQRADLFATRHLDFTKPVYFGLENCR